MNDFSYCIRGTSQGSNVIALSSDDKGNTSLRFALCDMNTTCDVDHKRGRFCDSPIMCCLDADRLLRSYRGFRRN